MAVKTLALELIDDNPYNPRKHYHPGKVREMAQSLQENGLLQIPEGRESDGRVQLAYGHMRLRGFSYNQRHKEAGSWAAMPVDVKDISDQDMFHLAMEENLRRTDISPLEVARCIGAFSQMFPEVTEKEIGTKHSITEAHVSNMKRVLQLPEKILEKIDEGRINFTQGRELIILKKLENSEELMLTAIRSIRTEGRPYGHANTVEGMQVAVHDAVGNRCRPLDKQWEGYRWDILFDTRAAGCLECDKMIRTHPTKSATAHWCLDDKCWDHHQEEHREKAAAAAKAQMEAEILTRVAATTALEILPKKEPPEPVMIDETTVLVDQETFAKLEASNSCERISEGTAVRTPVEFWGELYVATGSGMGKVEAYHLVPREQFFGEVRTYKVPAGREYGEYLESLRNDPNGFYHGMLVKRGKEECVLAGPEVTFVTKVDEGDFSQEKVAIKGRKSQLVAADETGISIPIPCDSCAKTDSCDRSYFHVADDNSGRLVCEKKVPEALQEEPAQAVPFFQLEQDVRSRIAAAPAPAPQEIPEDILTLAREKAGTRAEVLDINDIANKDDYRREVKSGYTVLKGGYHDELRYMDNPAECTEKCTRGFHFGFDSKDDKDIVYFICTDSKCLAKKKAAFTRNKNAEGQARKKAEVKAVKEAIDLVGQVISDGKQLLDEEGKFANTLVVPRATLKLILLAQSKGKHTARYYYGEKIKQPVKWLWDKISAGTPENDRTTAKLFKAIDKLSDEALARLVVEFMFYYLMDHGDIGTYELQVEEPLEWMGITIEQEAIA